MKLLWLDWETYYDDLYTLKKLTPVEYVLDPRFESLGCSFAWADNGPVWVDGPRLPEALDLIDWANTMVVSHNMLFDGCILRWHYGKRPKMYGDTLAMSRAWLFHRLGKNSLADVAAGCNLPAKGKTIFKMKGVTYDLLRQDPVLYREFVDYGMHDAFLCREVFRHIVQDGFPLNQLEIIDMQIRMAVDPRFVFDRQLLTEHLAQVRAEKQQLLDAAGLVNGDDLMSNERFAQLLINEGVTPPRKISPTTGKETWAFSKQDKSFTALLEHDEPRVQAIAAARLGVKSTLEETRSEAFLRISGLPCGQGFPQMAPIPLKYSGAHTHRFSGDWGLNMQNLGRESKLRLSLRAPKGWQVVSVDAAQIEARMTAALCGQKNLVNQFRDNLDTYSIFASRIFGREINKTDHPKERQLGKIAILSLGYGAGWQTFQNMVRVQSKGEIVLEEDESRRIVQLYRTTNAAIAGMWNDLDDLIKHMANGGAETMVGPVRIEGHTAWLPNGMRLVYRDLHQGDRYGRVQWFYNWGRFEKVLYGPKVLENFIQSLAFIVVMEAARRVRQRSKGVLVPSHQVHDELVYLVPEAYAENVKEMVVEEMKRPVQWMPDVPLFAEGNIGDSYGDC